MRWEWGHVGARIVLVFDSPLSPIFPPLAIILLFQCISHVLVPVYSIPPASWFPLTRVVYT